MPEGHQHDLLLLLARDLAMNLATAVLIVDREGSLVFYNERAEDLLGRPFSDARLDPEKPIDWEVTGIDDEPLPRERWPLTVAVRERRPAHGALRLTRGERPAFAVTAFPLLGVAGDLVGACSIFWEENGER